MIRQVYQLQRSCVGPAASVVRMINNGPVITGTLPLAVSATGTGSASGTKKTKNKKCTLAAAARWHLFIISMAPITVRVRTPGRMLRISLEPTSTIAQLRAAVRADVNPLNTSPFHLSKFNMVSIIIRDEKTGGRVLLLINLTPDPPLPPPSSS